MASVLPIFASLCTLLVLYHLGSLPENISSYNDRIINGTELILTFLVHRHGDRTPIKEQIPLSVKKEVLMNLTQLWGYGQLTNAGIQTAYDLGKFIRRRYSQLLSPSYNESEIYIRSTDMARTKKTILAAMAAVYPSTLATPAGRWSDFINWSPIPYTTVPLKYDKIEFLSSCPKFTEYFFRQFEPKYWAAMDRYKNLINEVSEIIEFNITSPGLIVYTYENLICEISLGIDIGSRLMTMMPDLREASMDAYEKIFCTEENKALQSGLLLKDFIDASLSAIAGNVTQPVRVYSAHDFSVYSFQAVAQVIPQGPPKYGAAFALELRKVQKIGKYVVLPVYLSSPNEREKYLRVQGCKLFCDFNQFVDITAKYTLTEDEWKTGCGANFVL